MSVCCDSCRILNTTVFVGSFKLIKGTMKLLGDSKRWRSNWENVNCYIFISLININDCVHRNILQHQRTGYHQGNGLLLPLTSEHKDLLRGRKTSTELLHLAYISFFFFFLQMRWISGVLLKLCRWILGYAINFLSPRSFYRKLSLF